MLPSLCGGAEAPFLFCFSTLVERHSGAFMESIRQMWPSPWGNCTSLRHSSEEQDGGYIGWKQHHKVLYKWGEAHFPNDYDAGSEINPKNPGQCFQALRPVECSKYSCPPKSQLCLLLRQAVIFLQYCTLHVFSPCSSIHSLLPWNEAADLQQWHLDPPSFWLCKFSLVSKRSTNDILQQSMG